MSEELNNTIDKFFEDVYAMRKDSLEKDGEFGIGNLVFKELRSRGYFDKLKDLKNSSVSKDLSLEGLNEATESNLVDRVNTLDTTGLSDGTYIINDSGEAQSNPLKDGYQVSYYRPEITDAEKKEVLRIIGNKLGQPYVGIYGGDKEISFKLPDINKALTIAKIFNQESIWDNSKGDYGYVDNNYYDEDSKVDYTKAIEELKKIL